MVSLPALHCMGASQPEYWGGLTILFIFAYCGIEMDKASKATNFEPEVYKVK